MGGFHLFDSDWMFEAAFVEKVIALLAIERASCACLVNLDRESGSEQASFVVDERTTRDPYRDRLRGFGPGDGWLYEMNRFGCNPYSESPTRRSARRSGGGDTFSTQRS